MSFIFSPKRNPLLNAADNTTMQSINDVITQSVLDMSGFEVGLSDPTLPDPGAFEVTSSGVCAEGQVEVGPDCVDCAVGTFFDSATGSCMACPIGEFQNMTAQLQCFSCGPGFTSELEGSTTSADCFDGKTSEYN